MDTVATLSSTVDTVVLRNRHEKVSTKYAKLQGQRTAIAKIAESLADRVAKAKGRQGCAAEAATVFNEMQRRAHALAVADFEALLSAILHDVLPGEGSVQLDLSIKAGAPSLNVNLLKNGNATDVLDDNGGAVTNVVCAGLKFATLSRTNNRKFMVLDEPDCWVKPYLVPAFLKVISDVATQAKTQTMIVSHHPAELLGDEITRVQFSVDDQGYIHATALEPVVALWEDDETPGIRSVELINYMAHKHTVIPCFPGATAFIGDNNLGKSAALVSNFRAVAYNASSDQCINHDAKSATIIYHLEKDQHLIWSRDPARNPVVLYELYQGDELVREGRPPSRNTAPDWVTALLGIQRVDGLDLQLSSQKLPVFLLDQSASVRAQMLSIGRESGHLARLMQTYEDLKRTDKVTVRTGEADLEHLFRQLSNADDLDDIESAIAQQRVALRGLETGTRDAIAILELERRFATSQLLVIRAEREVKAALYLPVVPLLHDTQRLEHLIGQLATGEACAAVLPPRQLVKAPLLHDTQQLERLIGQLTTGAVCAAATQEWQLVKAPLLHDLAPLIDIGKRIAKGELCAPLRAQLPSQWPALPLLHDTEGLARMAVALEQAARSLAQAEVASAAAEADLVAGQAAFAALMRTLGDRCPLCDAPFSQNPSHHHV